MALAEPSIDFTRIPHPAPVPDASRDQAIAWAGETVEMTGVVTLQGGWQVLTTEPGGWRRRER